MQVRVGQMPGKPKRIQIEEGATASEAIAEAGLSIPSGFEIRLNGEPANGNTTLADGDRVFLVKAVKGNHEESFGLIISIRT